MDKQQEFKNITTEMVELYEKKNHDYGDAFGQTFAELGIISAVTRISDKTNRLKSLATKAQRVDDERIEDTLMDLANYAVMTLIELKSEAHREKFPKSMVENNRQNQQLKITERTNLRGIGMNTQEEIKALKERIAELEKQVEQEKEFPQEDDMFWFINTFGKPVWATWGESITNRQLIEIGNIFRTKEHAEFVVEKLKVEAELRKFSRPFEPMVSNFHMILDMSDGSVDTRCMVFGNVQGAIYFESKEKAEEAISTVGVDRIKKYIFEVED